MSQNKPTKHKGWLASRHRFSKTLNAKNEGEIHNSKDCKYKYNQIYGKDKKQMF